MVSLLLRPESLDEAVAALAEHGGAAKVIAGGTAIVLMLQNRLIAPDVLVSLNRIAGLDDIEVTSDGYVRIGALSTLATAERSPLVQERLKVLSDTYHQVANVRIRNAATAGGNLTEADYASDPPAVLVALRARVRVVGPDRRREIPLSELFTGFFETSVAADELLTDIVIPPLATSARAIYLKFTTRSTEDRPCVGICAIVDRDSAGACTDLRVVVGAVDEIPWEIPFVEQMALGQHLSGELIGEIAERYAVDIDPLSDLRGSSWYRKEMIRVFVRRALEQVSVA
jgi:carbon-monoxide dehydrogenase medium subunit